MKVSKDGGVTFHEIAEDFDPATGVDRSLEAAKAKGYKPYADVSKDGKTFTIDGSSDSLKAAQAKGYMLAGTAADVGKRGVVGAGESAARGVAQGATFGFADEAQAALRAPFSKHSYKELRDEYRSVDEDAAKENPKSFYGAQVATGLAGGVGGIGKGAIAAGGKTLGQIVARGAGEGAALGGLSGVGSSERENAGGIAMDAAVGAAVGGVTGAAVPLALRGGVKAIAAVRGAKEAAKESSGPAIQAMKEAARDVDPLGIPGVDAARKLGASVKGAVQGVRSARDLQREISSLKVSSGKVLGEGAEDGIQDLGSDLLEAGPSRTKEFVSARAASAGGQLDAEQVKRILEMGVDRRLSAREFNAKRAAAELAPLVDELGGEFNRARSAGYGSAQSQAMQGLNAAATERVLPALYDTMEKSTRSKLIQGRTRAALEDVNNLLTRGDSAAYEVAPGDWRKIAPAERFKRMQYARQLLDGEIDWNKENKIGIGEQLLRKMRDELDTSLKSAPMKSEGDAFFSAGKDVEAGLFDATEFRQANGKYDVDEFKLAKLFGDNDAAGRFGKDIEKAREYVKDPKFSPASRAKIETLLDKLDKTRATAADARDIMSMRMKNGPSSPAIESQSYLLNKNNLPTEAIGAPANYINNVDQFMREYGVKGYGKKYSELSAPQKNGLNKLFLWVKKNPNASQSEMQRAANALLAPKGTP